MQALVNFFKAILGPFRRSGKIAALALRNRLRSESALGTVPTVVSLTSHGDRVARLWITLESIANGTSRPSRILVWLDKSLKNRKLPSNLERLRTRGVEFCFVNDIGPHQKYFYAIELARKANMSLATVDDDCIYPAWWLDRLYDGHIKTPDCIVCYRARVVAFSESSKLKPYNDWPFANYDHPDPCVFFTGVSGVMYPQKFLSILESCGEVFRQHCPRADDIWLNYVASKNSFPARQLFHDPWDFPEVPMTQHLALWTSNQAGGNDDQLAATYDCETLHKLARSALAEHVMVISQ